MAHDDPANVRNVRFGTNGHTVHGSTQTGRAAADHALVNPRTSQAYLASGALAVCCYLVVPGLAGSKWLFEAVGLSAAVAVTAGLLRNRPQPRLPWVLFVIAQVTFFVGDFFYYTFDLSFPSTADGFYLAYYPLLAAGLVMLIRRRSKSRDRDWDWANLLDVVIVTVGFGLVSWVFLVEPNTHDEGASLMSSLVSGAYPVMDVLLLAVLTRLMFGAGARPRSFYLMVTSVLCLIVTDTIFTAIELSGTYAMGSVLDAGWMTSYLLWGAAALDPSMRQLSAPARVADSSLTTRRILMLAGAVLIGPATILVDQHWPVAGFDTHVAVWVTAAIFLLAQFRMLGLVATLREVIARHQRAERRETILRHAATALTAAPDREYVRLAAVEGASALGRDLPGVEVSVDLGHRGGTRQPQPGDREVEVSLATRASPYGRLVLTSSRPVPNEVVDGLGTLGAQIALALEAVALSEGLSEQRTEARVGALVQNSSDLILLIDADLVIRYATPSVAHSLGHKPEELIGTSAPTLADPADQHLVREFYQRLASRPGKSVTAEWRMRRADGGLTDFEATVTNLLANPSVRGIVVTAHDITDRKALEDGLKRQVKELEELDQIRTDFVAAVSHELRTPLTNIMGEVELLQDGDRGELTGCQAHGLDVIDRNSNRLFMLIDDLLTLSEVENGALVLHPEETTVSSLVRDVGTQAAPVAKAKSVTLEIDYGPQAGVIVADPVQLDRALSNLLDNAVKFTPAGGTAALKVSRVGDDVEFRVSDTGVGIPEEEQVRLFTRFFRSSVATRLAIQGTGLGLVIVKRIVEAHGGSVSIVSKPGVGTTVTVRLPAGGVSELEVGAA